MKSKTVFYCSECGNETPKWAGRCPACGAWNTLVEAKADTVSRSSSSATSRRSQRNVPVLLDELDMSEELRFSTGIQEFDRVLGGGAVRGSMVLVGGAPGIGKSTLLLQACGTKELRSEKILYVTGEESQRQIKLRAQRLGVGGDSLYVLAETGLDEILSAAETMQPTLLIIDSIQTVFDAEISSAPGSVAQVRECTMSIMRLAKSSGITVFIVGHVNKDGAIAGPKVLEHMVDCVLYFEGDRSLNYRMLRAAKNRFGSTNEIGVFEMTSTCLRGVENPSEMLLSGRPEHAPGSCVTCVMEGSRPLLAEIQALVPPSSFSSGRRTSNGMDINRTLLLLAVLEKRCGMHLSGCDAYINVVGGLELNETAADLAAILAIASSFRDIPVSKSVAAVGEVGLTGELRYVNSLNQRLAEIARLGFTQCVIPAHAKEDVTKPDGLELIPAKTVADAVRAVLG